MAQTQGDRRETEQREPADGGLSTDTIFDTLSNRRRRYALHYLKRVDGPVAIRDLSEQLAAWENGIDRSQVVPRERKRLYTALHQTHLPKMHALGVVDYDSNRGVVALNGTIAQFDIYFDLVGSDDVPWSQFYLALGTVATSLLALAWLGVPPFSALQSVEFGLAGALAFTGVAAYHVFRDHRHVLGAGEGPPEPVPPQVVTLSDPEHRQN